MNSTVKYFAEAKSRGEPIAMITAYDATSAALAQAAGITNLLVGDSLGMVVQGRDSTLPVTLDDICYHTRWVVRGAPESFVIADMPFMSYQVSVEDGLRACGRVVKESGAHAVKLEGGTNIVPLVKALVDIGIPVIGHIGMQPQSVNLYGGYGKRGKSSAGRTKLLDEAQALEAAGIFSIVLENIPHKLAGEISGSLVIPTIGIGAGPECDGQIQVFHDLLGLQPDFKPRHTRRFGEIGQAIVTALAAYADEVHRGKFVSK
ncbi:MAG: 3-methyl-2-oxobutanoate hydroxymethyltransferase [Candidatus Marinimicrobia bacterium]|nr:3-methyl-2-oxobutanoate hydroxymethyltransferase [Candidatus Neomarinimicrobiota bacterium]